MGSFASEALQRGLLADVLLLLICFEHSDQIRVFNELNRAVK